MNNPLINILILLGILILNFPVVNYLGKLKFKDCKCAKGWKINYLYYYLLFWYASSAIQILVLFITPKIYSLFIKSIFYNPVVVISGVSYTFYIMTLWSYIECLKESDCQCSKIKKNKFVISYTWLLFLLYVVSVSYLASVIFANLL
jgi:hypothetical protein